MKIRKNLLAKAGILLAGLLLCSGMTVFAAPAVKGDTELTVKKDETVTAKYTITSDGAMENAKLTLSYDKSALTYMSGSGGNNFSGNGGNGSIELSSRPNDTKAEFTVKFKGKADGDTTVAITACTITVGGEELDLLNEKAENTDLEGEEDEGEGEGEEEGQGDIEASYVIDGRTFYVRRPLSLENFEIVHKDVQGIESRALKHNTLDLYVLWLVSDNGSYRDYFVLNQEAETVIPYVEMKSGPDTVIFLEPDPGVEPPVRYSYVDLGWGPKYTIPAYKHVTIDGIDEIFDDTNYYLVYGINQDGEKGWYSFDYDKNSLQLFDETAYQGEQNYIEELETKDEGLRSEIAHQLERYNTNMGRRLFTILFLIIVIVVLVNILIFMYLRMKKMQMPEEDFAEERKEAGAGSPARPRKYITGSLEENESDFQEPENEFGEDFEEDDGEIELEIIDLDDLDDLDEEE